MKNISIIDSENMELKSHLLSLIHEYKHLKDIVFKQPIDMFSHNTTPISTTATTTTTTTPTASTPPPPLLLLVHQRLPQRYYQQFLYNLHYHQYHRVTTTTKMIHFINIHQFHLLAHQCHQYLLHYHQLPTQTTM